MRMEVKIRTPRMKNLQKPRCKAKVFLRGVYNCSADCFNEQREKLASIPEE